jgi:hypothetical protein
VQSKRGFRAAGKVLKACEFPAEVKAGQLMRIDATGLRLALTAKRSPVAASRAFVALSKPPHLDCDRNP